MDSGDRLSALGDAALGHILSFLPAAEAARAAALSRRWRHVFPAVHTLSFREAEREFAMGYEWFRPSSPIGNPYNDDVRAPRFAIGLGAALLGRDRPGARAAAAPLRALRVAFDEYGFRGGDATAAVDAWVAYAAYHAGDAMQVELRLDDAQPVCGRQYALRPPRGLDADDSGGGDDDDQAMDDGNDDGGEDEDQSMPMDADYYTDGGGVPGAKPTVYTTPRILFSCAALRSLRLGGCWLDLPSAIALPALDTLHLTRVTGRGGAVQRLVSACPRLADLTLEDCGGDLTALSVRHARLRRLALRCCHDLAAVAADSSELRAFEYRGAVPGRGFLRMERPPKISLCTLDFCGEEPARPPGLGFLQPFAGVERLHLTSARLGRGVVAFLIGLKFPALRNLELTGMLPEDDAAAVAAVAGILERAPLLETLSLFFLPEPHPVVTDTYFNDNVDEEGIHAAHKLRYDRHAAAALAAPDVEIPACLRERTREINLVHYQGAMAQRMLAKFLLRNAPVVDEVCCEFARGPLAIQTKLMEEIEGWVMNKSAKMMFF